MIKKATLFYSKSTRELLNDNEGVGSEPGFCNIFNLYSEVIALSANGLAYGSGRTPSGELSTIKILRGGDDWHIEFVDHYLKIASRMETTIEVFHANKLVRIIIKLFKGGKSNCFVEYTASFIITSGHLCGQAQFLNPSLLKK